MDLVLLEAAERNTTRDPVSHPPKKKESPMKVLMLKGLIAMTFALCAVCPRSSVLAQSSESVFNVVNSQVHVDGNSGNDQNNGFSTTSKVRTLAKAMQIASAENIANRSVKVNIYPGTYREQLRLIGGFAGQTDKAIIVEAVQTGTAIITGSDNWTGGWTHSAGGVFHRSWTKTWGSTPGQPWGHFGTRIVGTVAERRELVIINGDTPLRQVLTQAELVPGTFCVVLGEQRLYVYPPAGVNLNTNPVEVAVRPDEVWYKNNSPINYKDGFVRFVVLNNLKLKGLIFQNAAEGIGGNTVNFFSCNNVLVEDCTIRRSSWGGIGVHGSSNVTIHSLTADSKTTKRGDCGLMSMLGPHWSLTAPLREGLEAPLTEMVTRRSIPRFRTDHSRLITA